MPVVNPGSYRQWVTLDDPIVDATPVTFSPNRVKCSIQPSSPSAFDENKVTYMVQMRFHPQVTFNTRVTYVDRQNVSHELFVRGIQNVEMQGRHLVLLCEEVQTP